MKRLIAILAIIGVALYLGLATTSLPLPLPFRSNSSAIRSLAEQVLKPLDGGQVATTESVQKALDQLRSPKSGGIGYRTRTPREEQALALLGQAVEERKAVIQRIQGRLSRNPLDTIPGNWHVIGKPDQKVDPSAMNDRRRMSFWASRELTNWRERAAYYRTSIDALLAPPPSTTK